MFVSSNTIITTEKGNMLANSDYNKIFTVNGFKEINKNIENKKTSFIKTNLFPTLAIGNDTTILCGRLEVSDEKLFIKNNFYSTESIKSGDYLFIPKVSYNVESFFNRTMLWLYAKYIASGYFCLEKQTHKPTIIINLSRFSRKEAVKLKKYDGVSYDLNKKIIVIQNQEIINEFSTKKRNLNLKVYGCEDNLAKFFIHSLLIENNNKIDCKYKTMAYDIFMYAYSKLGKIFKITEYKENENKRFCLTESEPDDYIIVQKQLYVKITNISEGKLSKGISIENPEKSLYCIGFIVMR